jgi:hypothetical protein
VGRWLFPAKDFAIRFRDWTDVTRWADTIAEELMAMTSRPA